MTRRLLTHADALVESHRIQLKAVLANCPGLDIFAQHVRTFGHMVTDLQGDQLPEWIESARQQHVAAPQEMDQSQPLAK
ncbi:hypothetical protein [Streptomyces sp. TLI_185]|uniref:hypothetical protein n=1 Tax=Streptomyces sp. TLI_185 TaxID=2485151 RepID=UPI000F4F2BA7|nr:hypothetical protein [Streptomyces sp. TLI_185]